MIPICVIGCGISGMFCLLALEQAGIPPHHICIVDPYFDGGDLQRIWTSVMSNTSWSKLVEAIRIFKPHWICPPEFSTLEMKDVTPVSLLAKCIRQTILPYLQSCKKIQQRVISIQNQDSIWNIHCETETLQANLLCIGTGMKPKEFACDMPQIPLSIALNKNLLQTYVSPYDRVIVFGTSHSGTLVLQNLEECKIPTIGIYKHKEPFYFERDGHYDGIKEISATIADAILKKEYKYIQLLSMDNTSQFIKAIRSATWAVSAIGFEPRNQGFEMEEKTLWKFGAAFPPSAPDGIHKDISVLVFAQQIQRCLPNILEAYQRLDFHTSL
jgi:hypothetical protein